MSWCQQRTQPQSAEVDLVAIMKCHMGEIAVTGRRRQYFCSVCRAELVCTGQEVGVQMGVGGEGHLHTTTVGYLIHGAQVAAHVDDECTAVAQIDEVGRIAQSLIDERDKIDVSHLRPFLWPPVCPGG